MSDFPALPDINSDQVSVSVPNPKPLDILVFATEWAPRHGGLSTLNQKLCVALAATGRCRVVCYIPPESGETPREDRGVLLLPARAVPGFPASDTALLLRRPGFATLPRFQDFAPDFVVGHDDKTGPHALAACQDHFPSAKRVQFVHTEVYPLQGAKTHSSGQLTSAKACLASDLVREADLAVGVGPLLAEVAFGYGAKRELAYQLDPGFELSTCEVPLAANTQRRLNVLVIGRTKDPEVKGLERACVVLADVAAYVQHEVNLIIRGSDDQSQKHLSKLARTWNRKCPNLKIQPREFTVEKRELAQDWRAAHLLIAPSTVEGFGLVALEAAERGVPFLISNPSGFAKWLNSLDSSAFDRHVINPPGDEEALHDAWVDRITRIYRDPEGARRECRKTQGLLAPYTWERAANQLLDRLARL